MNRREFLNTMGMATVATFAPRVAFAAGAGGYGNLLILVELKGGKIGRAHV